MPQTELEQLKEQANALMERLSSDEQIAVLTELQAVLCAAIDQEALVIIFRNWLEDIRRFVK